MPIPPPRPPTTIGSVCGGIAAHVTPNIPTAYNDKVIRHTVILLSGSSGIVLEAPSLSRIVVGLSVGLCSVLWDLLSSTKPFMKSVLALYIDKLKIVCCVCQFCFVLFVCLCVYECVCGFSQIIVAG